MASAPVEEWRVANSKIKYPFVDSASLAATNGAFLPESVILDASIIADPQYTRVWISSITRNGSQITFNIANSINRAFATGVYNLATAGDTVYLLTQADQPAGVLVIDNTSNFLQGWPTGTSEFLAAATTFSMSALEFLPGAAVTEVRSDNAIQSGDLCWVGSDGVQLRTTENPNEVVIDIVGDPLYELDQSQYESVAPGILRYFDVVFGEDAFTVGPDNDGVIHLEAQNLYLTNDALRITADGNTLSFELAGQTQE